MPSLHLKLTMEKHSHKVPRSLTQLHARTTERTLSDNCCLRQTDSYSHTKNSDTFCPHPDSPADLSGNCRRNMRDDTQTNQYHSRIRPISSMTPPLQALQMSNMFHMDFDFLPMLLVHNFWNHNLQEYCCCTT